MLITFYILALRKKTRRHLKNQTIRINYEFLTPTNFARRKHTDVENIPELRRITLTNPNPNPKLKALLL